MSGATHTTSASGVASARPGIPVQAPPPEGRTASSPEAGSARRPGRSAPMADDRWRVAGLASPRSEWFFQLARWSTAAAIPVDFVKCMSASEVRTRFARGEAYSALLVGDDVSGLTRDLITEATGRGTEVIVVGDSPGRPWRDIGAAALLPEDFESDALVGLLREHAAPLSVVDGADSQPGAGLPVGWQGRLVVVTGTGGSGSSLLAMALAQGFAAEASNRGLVLLADFALHADQAMLHDSRDAIPGLLELAEACQSGWHGHDRLRHLFFEPAGRGYHLLLGLRRHRDWAAVHRRPLETAMGGLIRTYRFVIVDTDADTEGESDTGSSDVEDRNRLARTAMSRGDLVLVVGCGDTSRLHSLARALTCLADAGVDAGRLLPVVNRVTRRPRIRAGIAGALSRLMENTAAAGIQEPVFVPEHRGVEPAVRDGVAPPAALGRYLAAAVSARLERKGWL